mmetsp:Transcript_62771/g.182007  ORF Transcript_62771/g.182007 Transcript_62771/m.182007 type:complete len:225 (+) Transcript_62771:911-1585(+)
MSGGCSSTASTWPPPPAAATSAPPPPTPIGAGQRRTGCGSAPAPTACVASKEAAVGCSRTTRMGRTCLRPYRACCAAGGKPGGRLGLGPMRRGRLPAGAARRRRRPCRRMRSRSTCRGVPPAQSSAWTQRPTCRLSAPAVGLRVGARCPEVQKATAEARSCSFPSATPSRAPLWSARGWTPAATSGRTTSGSCRPRRSSTLCWRPRRQRPAQTTPRQPRRLTHS